MSAACSSSTATAVLVGILTRRDVYSENPETVVRDAMTPRDRMVVGSPTITVEQAIVKMHARRIEKLPLLDEDGRCVGLIVMKDVRRLQENPRATLDGSGRLAVGGSVGAIGDYLDRCDALVDAGCDVIIIDVAHGWADHVLQAVRRVRRRHRDLPLVVGNVATGDADGADRGGGAWLRGAGRDRAGSVRATPGRSPGPASRRSRRSWIALAPPDRSTRT